MPGDDFYGSTYDQATCTIDGDHGPHLLAARHDCPGTSPEVVVRLRSRMDLLMRGASSAARLARIKALCNDWERYNDPRSVDAFITEVRAILAEGM